MEPLPVQRASEVSYKEMDCLLKYMPLNDILPRHPVDAGLFLESVGKCWEAACWQQCTLAHLSGNGKILNLSLAPRSRLEQVSDIRAVPPASVDLLICDSTYLRRASSTPSTWRVDDGHALLTGCTARTARNQVTEVPASAMLRWNISRVLDQFSRISTREGLCLLGYQHVLASAWLALGEALAASDWRCVKVVPWPARVPSDPYLRSRVLLWDAFLVCRKRSITTDMEDALLDGQQPGLYVRRSVSVGGQREVEAPELVVVKSTATDYAAERVTEYTGMLEKAGHKRIRRSDRENLWRALVISQARLGHLGELTEGELLLADALLND